MDTDFSEHPVTYIFSVEKSSMLKVETAGYSKILINIYETTQPHSEAVYV
jgi:hypothetical protein